MIYAYDLNLNFNLKVDICIYSILTNLSGINIDSLIEDNYKDLLQDLIQSLLGNFKSILEFVSPSTFIALMLEILFRSKRCREL